ncbi:hypothetical protein QFC21_006451 [Naganishia friedmannii]|uniref:Uncharacterized protein n=1 Tax=Naganishia friedmannii TaxID=89922 RepID=A0ACC2V3C0_9TREE|nr:hypothetical protein QFC21_006451 [Naganishia friedmannii]
MTTKDNGKAPTLKQFLQVVPVGPNEWESVYGGCVLALCVSAAFASLPTNDAGRIYDVYSVLGTFLGPTSTKTKLRFTVEDIRTTKSFATRKVEVWQEFPDGNGSGTTSRRRTMIQLVDFHVREPATSVLSGMTYSKRPLHPESCCDDPDALISQDQYLTENQTSAISKQFHHVFPLFFRYLDMKPIPESMGVAKALGLNSAVRTSQDDLPLQQRTNAHWWRIKEVKGGGGMLTTPGERAAAVAFFDAVSAVSTLEFSLRFFSPPNPNEWLLHEQHTENAGMGRTFSTGRVWDKDGKCVASMSQQSIMRAKAEREGAKL